jgi:ubiquinone/menaquinone biosynthesis C-methylase UbiE
MKKIFCGNDMDRMPDWAFKAMAFMFSVTDLFISSSGKLDPFQIRHGQTVVDYGCGTGRYLKQASQLAGEQGTVYAVDIHELAIESAARLIRKYDLKNVSPVLASANAVGIPSGTADIVYALDMFHMVSDPNGFLKELCRIIKPGGVLYLEDGHQPRSTSKEKVNQSGCWEILEETRRYLKCSPKK